MRPRSKRSRVHQRGRRWRALPTGMFSQAPNDVAGIIQQWGIYGQRRLQPPRQRSPRDRRGARGPQDPTGRAGGDWFSGYTAIRTINAYLRALDNAVRPTAGGGVGVRASPRRSRRGTSTGSRCGPGPLGMPIDVDRPIADDPAPFCLLQTRPWRPRARCSMRPTPISRRAAAAFPFTVAPGIRPGFDTRGDVRAVQSRPRGQGAGASGDVRRRCRRAGVRRSRRQACRSSPKAGLPAWLKAACTMDTPPPRVSRPTRCPRTRAARGTGCTRL